MPFTPLDQLLQDRPMQFMRRYAVSPPDGAGSRTVQDPNRLNFEGKPMNKTVTNQTLSSPLRIWSDPDSIIKEGQKNIDFRVVKGGAVLYANVVDVPRDKPGAKTIDFSPVYSDARVPMYFLPWNSGSLVSMHLRESHGEDNDDPDNPGIFFTAALSGCSVFVDGHPARPRIVHAGLNGKLAMNARQFWEERLADLARLQGRPIDEHLLSIDKSQYMNTIWAKAYRNWLENEYKNSLTINAVEEWACVFGIRFGRLWSFYLQKNATVTTFRVLKKSEVQATKQRGVTTYSQKGTALPVVAKAKGTGLFSRHNKIYTLTQSFARPIAIEEFYPTSSGQGRAIMSIEDKYVALL